MSSTETASGERPSTALADQMSDGDDVLRREPGARLDSDQHAGFGRLLRFEKDRVLGKGEVDARLFDLGQRHDGALQLALERAAVVDVFGEFGGAEVHLVEKFEADAAGSWEDRWRPW